jgi:hypothetical protein
LNFLFCGVSNSVGKCEKGGVLSQEAFLSSQN